jgi:hypothetical protein
LAGHRRDGRPRTPRLARRVCRVHSLVDERLPPSLEVLGNLLGKLVVQTPAMEK